MSISRKGLTQCRLLHFKFSVSLSEIALYKKQNYLIALFVTVRISRENVRLTQQLDAKSADIKRLHAENVGESSDVKSTFCQAFCSLFAPSDIITTDVITA